PIYWGILDLTGSHVETRQLFTTEDWNEMLKSFEDEVEIIEHDIPNVIYLLFDEVEQIIKDNEKNEAIVLAIDNISLQEIESKHKIILSEQDKVNMIEICSWASAIRRNKGRSITLRARVGQKCDFRGTLKHSINKLEVVTGLRSGGLPEPHRKKIFLDSLDLAITMRDILYTFFESNANSPDEDLHKLFVLGFQSLGTNICRYGKLCTTALPNSIRTLACLEKFYIEMKNIKVIFELLPNDIALSHARAHRKRRKGEDQEHANIEVGGCFGKINGTPISKNHANGNRTTSPRLNSASAEKSLGVVLGKVGMTYKYLK
ncbi:15492_t:CDS:2, partial [Racocetra fulgida]